MTSEKEFQIQRRYYAETAHKYNDMHVRKDDEHFFALSFLLAIVDYFEIQSILDVGSGTGRAVAYIKEKRPDIAVRGIEPIKELRDIGYGLRLSQGELFEGDATAIAFADEEFDVVCEFGALHHVRNTQRAVSEMLRVARKGIFISDCNNFGRGAFLHRTIKQLVNSLGLWKIADFLKTRGKGYTVSEGDGLAYSYSVFNNYEQIRRHCKAIHLLNTSNGGVNPYRSASHVALFGVKKEKQAPSTVALPGQTRREPLVSNEKEKNRGEHIHLSVGTFPHLTPRHWPLTEEKAGS